MGYFKNLTANMSFNVKREEFEAWEDPKIKKALHFEFATKNSSSVKAFLPIACVLALFIMSVYSFGVHLGLYDFQLNYAIVYLALFIISFVFYFVIKYQAKHIEQNDKKILATVSILTAFYMVWVSLLLFVNRNLEASIVIYTAVIVIITQGIYLAPRYSAWFVTLSTSLFLITNFARNGVEELDFEASVGIIVLSFVSFIVSYSRYCNRCRAVYNKILIVEQNQQLDSMIKQLQEQKDMLEKTNEELENAFVRDSMTGLYNRWYWNKIFEDGLERCKNAENMTAVYMMDVDNFKNVNDTKGHSMGDKCLIAIAEVLERETKDIENCNVYRMGGEEFVVFCEDIDKANAIKLANAILKGVQNIRIVGLDTMLTVSVGVHIQKVENRNDIEEFVVKADKAMYESKNTGKNKITLSF